MVVVLINLANYIDSRLCRTLFEFKNIFVKSLYKNLNKQMSILKEIDSLIKHKTCYVHIGDRQVTKVISRYIHSNGIIH